MQETYLKELLVSGKSYGEIATETGLCKSSVIYWAKKYNLSSCRLSFAEEGPRKRRCGKCGEVNKDKFYGNKKSICGSCHNKYVIQRGRLWKAKAIEYKGGKCVKCGYQKYQTSLDFHHLDPREKDPKFSSKRGWTWERTKKELDKCVLLCRNCHAAVHTGEILLT